MALIIFILFRLWSFNEEVTANPLSYILLSKNVYLLPESKMYLQGKTNINRYTCDCVSASVQPHLITELWDNKIIFKEARLEIFTGSINCHNSIYNYNIKNSLDIKNYPVIKIELIEAWKKDKSKFIGCEEWFELESVTYVTVKNKTRTQNVKAKAFQLSTNKFRITGSHTIYMKDYDIKVPEIMLGLIEVEDKIDFFFDLVIEIS